MFPTETIEKNKAKQKQSQNHRLHNRLMGGYLITLRKNPQFHGLTFKALRDLGLQPSLASQLTLSAPH